MASLNTLRTKFGVVLSVVIGLALLAFILSLKTEMGFSGNDPKVAVIDGNKIRYSEYLDEYENVKAQSGASESDEQQLDMLYNAAWQGLFSKYVLRPGFEKLGVVLTEAERKAIVSGEMPTQTMYSLFADRAGIYNVEALRNFLDEATVNPRAAAMWAALMEQARNEREVAKYLDLIRGGVAVNDLDVALGVAAANKSYSGKWVAKRYNTLPDSLFTVSSSEIKTYYNSHKDRFKQQPSRSISYVVFDVNATGNDMLALEDKVRTEAAEFIAADDARAYARKNRNGSVGERYMAAAQLTDEEAADLTAGRPYGPVLKNNVWTASRVIATRMAPDSIGVRHMAVPYNETHLADSLAGALRAGADFALLSEGAGEERVYPFSAFPEEFVEVLSGVHKGDVVQIPAGNAIHIMQIYRADAPSKHYRIASLNYPVEASSATRRDLHGKAGIFAVDAAGSIEKFNEAASAAALTPRVASIPQGEREIRGLENSREIVRWANNADKNDVSEIFKVGDDYVVAILTEIDDAKYASVEKVTPQIRNILLRDKKYEHLLGELSGDTIEQAAESLGSEVETFENLRYGSFYVNGMGVEPRVVGAIAATETTGRLSAPVKGNSGIFVFQLDAVEDNAQQTTEAERVRLQATAESMTQQASFRALEQMADMEDLRARYF